MTQEFDIPFGKGGDETLKLDLYRPAAKGRLPGVVVIHGGAWRGGSRLHMRPFAAQFAAVGFIAATVQYRLCPKHPFPAQIEDVKCAVRWMRANADKYQIDSDHIGAVGASAGGHLALLLGTLDPKDGLEGQGGHAPFSSKVQAVVNYFGPFDLTLRDWDPKLDPLLIDFLGGTLDQRRDAYRRASPATYLDAEDAPVITFHGTKDEIVPFGQAQLIDRLTRKVGVSSHLEVMTGAGHGWLGTELLRTQNLATEFLNRHLRDGRKPVLRTP